MREQLRHYHERSDAFDPWLASAAPDVTAFIELVDTRAANSRRARQSHIERREPMPHLPGTAE